MNINKYCAKIDKLINDFTINLDNVLQKAKVEASEDYDWNNYDKILEYLAKEIEDKIFW